MRRFILLLLVPGLVLMSDRVSAQGKGKGHTKAKEAKEAHKDKDKGERATVLVVDREGHHRVIREYYTREALPPGLAKREMLPPGLRKQLRERGALPPGLEKHWVVVPEPLGRLLPPVPVHYHRYFVGNDLVIVDTQRNIVVTIVRDVLPPARR